jgi:RNA-directed DNA polymerase
VNTGASSLTPDQAEARVLGIQAKLHQWATDDPDRRFDDLFNLVCDPAFLLVGWRRVRGNKGARSAGVDGETAYYVETVRGEEAFLAELRASLKDRSFRPLPVRERLIPKPGSSKWRRLGIATVRDRVVQAALKLVLEPIWEADFQPCSYGFRPGRRAQDAIAEIHHLTSHAYEWVLEGDITACFDEISHSALLERVRRRIGDRRVLALVKAFLKAGILGEDGAMRDTVTGTPQGGILSPLLSNVALSVLDEHIVEHGQARAPSWVRQQRRHQGQPNYRIVRYADDFVVLVAGARQPAQALREQVAAVLATIGLRLSEEKTTICHIDEGFEFLGWRIQRHQQRGSLRRYVYTYPSVRHEAPLTERSCKGSAAGLSQQAGEAEDSPILETRGRVGAVLTTTGRVGTARRPGSGKQGEKADERNQRVRPRKRCAGSNLVDLGRSAAHDRLSTVDSDAGTDGPARRPRGRAAAYSWRGCRGIAGRLPRPTVTGERGKRPRSPAPCGQARRLLMALGRGGASVVVRGRESRPHGEGRQRAGRRGTGTAGGRW